MAAKLAVLSAFVSGILTNGVLELGVFHSLRGLGWASSRQRFGRADRVLHGFIVLQLGCLAISTPALLAIFGVLVAQGPRGRCHRWSHPLRGGALDWSYRDHRSGAPWSQVYLG